MSVFDAASLSEWEVIARLGVATGLGAIIGTERELDGHDAGTRTHALLALGAALFGAVSVGAFGDFLAVRDASNVQVDVTRVASYVAAGVGFLGGGAIVKHEHRVSGLTTAASLWAVAAMGLASGLGFYSGAVVAAGATIVLLLLDRPLGRLRRRNERTGVSVKLRAGTDPAALVEQLVAIGGLHAALRVSRDDESTTVSVDRVKAHEARVLASELAGRDDVLEFSVG